MTNLVVSDCDFVLFASGLVAGIDVKDPIGVDVERHLNVGDTARHRQNAIKMQSFK